MDQETLVQAVARKRAEVEAAKQAEVKAEQDFTIAQFQSVAQAVTDATGVLVKLLNKLEPKVEVKNFPKDTSKDVVTAVKSLGKTLKPQKVDNADVIKAIKLLNESIAKIPALMPRTEAVEVTNIAEVAQTLAEGQKKLTEALNKLELSPKITVPKPTVTVQPTDVKGVIKELKNVAKEIVDKPITPVSVTPTDPLVRFTPAHVDDDNAVQYFGYIATDGEWFIRKFDTSVSPKTLTFHFGTGGASAYNAAFAARAGLTYTMWTT